MNECCLGGFGFVYKYYDRNPPIAIKSINFRYDDFKITLRETIREYLFLMIASSLKIGPSLIRPFGFDILIFRESFVFSMELC